MLSAPRAMSEDEALIKNVYELADALNIEALRELSKTCSLHLHGKEMGALIRLARDGKHHAVNLLLNFFKGSYDAALIGYVLGGYDDHVETMLGLGALPGLAVLAYTQLKNKAKTIKFLARYPDTLPQFFLGLGRAGEIDLIAKFLPGHPQCIGMAACGLGYAGLIQEANQLLVEGVTRNDLLLAIAMGGHIAAALEQIDLHGANPAQAVYGFAHAGYIEQVDRFLADGVPNTYAIHGYARSGRVARVTPLLETPAAIAEAIEYYAVGFLVDQVNDLVEQGGSTSRAIEGYRRGKHFANEKRLLRLLSFTPDILFQEAIVQDYKNTNPSFAEKEIAFLAKARSMHFWMKYYSLGYHQALSLVNSGGKGWLLQCHSFVKEDRLPMDLVRVLTSMILVLPISETYPVLFAYNQFINSETQHSLRLLRQKGIFSNEYAEVKAQASLESRLQPVFRRGA